MKPFVIRMHVWLTDPRKPYKAARKVFAPVTITDKQMQVRTPARRYIIGTSAFFSEKTCIRVQMDRCNKIIKQGSKSSYMRVHVSHVLRASTDFRIKMIKAGLA